MTAHPSPPLDGDALLHAVTASLVALHRRYHGRAPQSATAQLIHGELLACVMGGVYTDVEKTMIELQQQLIVQHTRSAFQTAMQATFISEVERLAGRRVMMFVSNSHVGPDMEIELFLLAPGPGADGGVWD